MKIINFKAKKINGYLNFNIDFFSEVNFLTGINGSGKTTVVNGVSSLISPSLFALANSDYREMEVTVQDNANKKMIIWAKKSADKLQLGYNKSKKILEIPILSDEALEYYPSYKVREEQESFYIEQEAKYSDHPVLNKIKNLPTPMFLDIERRIDFFYRRSLVRSQMVHRRNSNIFKLNLHRSLLEAAELAERNYRQTNARKERLTDNFRKKIILSSIEYEETSGNFPDKFPSLDDKFFNTESQIKQTLIMLGLSESEISKSLTPFFKKLKDLSDVLPSDGNVTDFLSIGISRKKSSKNKKYDHTFELKRITAFMDWMVNKPQYSRIIKIKKHVDEYIKHSNSLNKPINDYLQAINKFLSDSGKQLKFNDTQNLVVKFKNNEEKPLTSLASGESQMVVILTHLYFNPDAKSANVFIIDEPELSLHIRWQELFVESIRAANPELQLILATHSPSIILEDIEHCIDLSGGKN